MQRAQWDWSALNPALAHSASVALHGNIFRCGDKDDDGSQVKRNWDLRFILWGGPKYAFCQNPVD